MSWVARILKRGEGSGSDAERERARQLAELSERDRLIVGQALPYTMTSIPRMQALIDAVRYVDERRLDGAFAECGVWRGGSVLTMILTLQEMGAPPRDIYLYDTFEGMTAPTVHDVSGHDPPAMDTWKRASDAREKPWGELFDASLFNEDQVRSTLLQTGYPAEHLHLVRGPVEQTLPAAGPGPLALLRLDTDWYESTLHELKHLYPKLMTGGVLIIDDFGHWDGCRKAVEEYFERHPPRPLLQRVDYTGRLVVVT